MNRRNSAYRVELAKPEHDEGMAALLEESAFEGAISVSFRRRPSVIASYERESEEALLYVLIEETEDLVVGMGAVTIRSIWLRGKIIRMAYLSGLRITPAHQKAYRLISQMYEKMYQSTQDRVDLYLTTIVSDNTDVIRMFEKKRKSMPEYRFDYDLETFLLGSKRGQEGDRIIPKGQIDGAVADLNWLKDRGAAFYGTPEAYGYRFEPTWKQYHIARYSGAYQMLAKLPTAWAGLPRFPKEGRDAKYLAAGVYTNENLEEIVDTLRTGAKEADFIMLTARKDSKLATLCRKRTPVIYRSRQYQVLFHDQKPLDLSEMAIDVAFL